MPDGNKKKIARLDVQPGRNPFVASLTGAIQPNVAPVVMLAHDPAGKPVFEPVREHPKGTRVIEVTEGSVTMQFRAAVRFWWYAWLAMPAACVFAPLFGGVIGFVLGTAQMQWAFSRGQYASPAIVAQASSFWAFLLFVIALAAAIITFRMSRPWVTVYADRERVQVGALSFDRATYGEFRIGYEISTGDALIKSDFHDIDLGLQGLRLVYGPWGEDLPYLVSKYHAPAIVLWMNLMIRMTLPPVAAPVTETGQRAQSFE